MFYIIIKSPDFKNDTQINCWSYRISDVLHYHQITRVRCEGLFRELNLRNLATSMVSLIYADFEVQFKKEITSLLVSSRVSKFKL